MNMNHAIFAFIFVVSVVSAAKPPPPEKVQEILSKQREDCRAQHEVDDKVFERATNGDFEADNHNLGCYMMCMLKKWDIIKKDGTYSLQTLYDVMQHDRKHLYDPKKSSCGNEADEDTCALAMKLYRCSQKELGKDFVFY